MAAREPLHRSRVLGAPWPGVYLVQIESARHFPRHSHANFGIGLIEHGAHRSASGRGAVEAHAGDLIAHNPGEVHDGQPLGGPTRRWRMVHMDPHALHAAVLAPGEAPHPGLELARPVMHDPLLRAALHRFFEQVDAAGSALACEEAWARVCGLLLQAHASELPRPSAAPGRLALVRDRLGDQLADPPSLAELAELAGLSRYQLLRRFSQAYGLPPHAWLQQQRNEHARQLIRQGRTLADAAAASGFADQSHMTRHFVRQFGFTPGAWRLAATPGGMSSRRTPEPTATNGPRPSPG